MILIGKIGVSSCFLILFFFVSCSTEDSTTTSVEVPLRLAPNAFIQGNYQVTVSIAAADMETVTASAKLAGIPGTGVSQRLILKDVVVGQNRQIKIQIWRGGDLVSSKVETVDLVKGEVNSFTIKMDKVNRPKTIISKKDNSKMVLIPSGSFQMGSSWIWFGAAYNFEAGKWEINDVSEGGSLASAKVQVGDYVLTVNDLVISSVLNVDEAKEKLKVGDRIKFVVLRDGKKIVLWGEAVADPDETPHEVQIGAFYIDAYEVTLGQYNQFLQETGHAALPDWVAKYSPTNNHPVIGVNWHDAVAYANWVGKRLPTEAEWEYAAGGGLVSKLYPWGDNRPTGRECNFADKNADQILRGFDPPETHADTSVDDGYQYTAPVGSFPPNGFGLYDVAGNVYEWCSDRYGKDYYKVSPTENPKGPGEGDYRVLRGGCWYSNTNGLRLADRNDNSPNGRFPNLGFRCVSGLN